MYRNLLASVAAFVLALAGSHSAFGLDVARRTMNVDKINGLDRPCAPGIPHPFRGKDVLVGIIDIEFDIHHPAFLDAQKKTRFIALWDQEDTTSPKRTGTAYGRIKKGSDLDADSTIGLINETGHGTGMASFAVGSDTTLPYYGIAPEAMIIGVKYHQGHVQQDVANGLSWIFDIADSLNVPCVVSLSIGLSSGPHDGTSLVDRAIDNVSGPGHIVVGAIGNDGDRRSHVLFQLEKGETKGSWIVPQLDSLKDPPRPRSFSAVDIWGEAGKTMSVEVMIMDDRTNIYRTSGIVLTTQQPPTRTYNDTLIWRDSVNKVVDTLYFGFETERASDLNRKPHISGWFLSYNPHLNLGISVSLLNNESGVVHAWNVERLAFKSNGISGFIEGDSLSTLNEVGGTAKSIITAGAYINKSKVITYNGAVFDKGTENEIGNLTNFSGTGPTVDGRIKPEVCAPGDMVIGAMSRRDPYNWQTCVWPDTNSTNGRYIRGTGTSVSSPLVAGVVALLLEDHPKLTVDSVKMLLSSTAIKDKFTGDLSMPNNRWGAGKVNAYGALAKLLGVTGNKMPEMRGKAGPVLSVISIAGKRFLSINGFQKANGGFRLNLYNSAGRKVMNVDCHEDRIPLPTSLAQGVYVADILCDGKTVKSKIVLY